MVEPDDQCSHGEHYLYCPLDTDGACRRGETAPQPLDAPDTGDFWGPSAFGLPTFDGVPRLQLRRVDPPDLIA